MVLRDAGIDGVGVVEVVCLADGERLLGRSGDVSGVDEGLTVDVLVEVVDEFLGTFRRDFLVIVTREEGTAIDFIVLLEEFLDTDEGG